MASTSAQTTTKRELVARITEQINRFQDEKFQAAQEQVGADLARGGERARKAKARLERLKGARMTKVLVKEVLETFLEEVVGELALGHRLEFREFGVFEVRQRLARKAQNPRTLEAVDVPAKRVVKFKPGRSMRALVCDNPDPLDQSEVSENLGAERSGDSASKAGGSSGGEAGKSASGPDSKSDSGSGSKSPPTPPKPKNPSSPF
ncbi:MAG TPA: HU family DNA-binding protein [Planctomycetota bacterium]|jgi:integration host factor subunit beta|nr:HU family DNA-binding protein [Planctomycetota bacterium]